MTRSKQVLHFILETNHLGCFLLFMTSFRVRFLLKLPASICQQSSHISSPMSTTMQDEGSRGHEKLFQDDKSSFKFHLEVNCCMMRITCLFITFSQYAIMIAEGPLNSSMSTIIFYKGEYFKIQSRTGNNNMESMSYRQCTRCSSDSNIYSRPQKSSNSSVKEI